MAETDVLAVTDVLEKAGEDGEDAAEVGDVFPEGLLLEEADADWCVDEKADGETEGDAWLAVETKLDGPEAAEL